MTEQEKMSLTKYDLYFESRLSKLEAIQESLNDEVKQIKKDMAYMKSSMKSDFRWLVSLMLALLGVMAKGFNWI